MHLLEQDRSLTNSFISFITFECWSMRFADVSKVHVSISKTQRNRRPLDAVSLERIAGE